VISCKLQAASCKLQFEACNLLPAICNLKPEAWSLRTATFDIIAAEEEHIMDAAVQPIVIPLWPNGAPGTEDWSQQEQETSGFPPLDIKVVRNIARPSLTAMLPDPAIATGTAVIVAPGGAFHFLAIDHEGWDVARWLNARGIAALVLKYRVLETAVRDEDFMRELREHMADPARMRDIRLRIGAMGVADGQQAVRVVRQRAAEWGIAPDRIGIMGFSAGGTVTTGVAARYDAESRPDFAAPIYTAPWEIATVPADAPPLFIALANDDQMAVDASVPLYTKWRAAGHPAELHIYAKGGHGFGMLKKGLPSDAWIERFGEWMVGQGFGG
jgi:acetyl esterase/lipase